MKLNSDLSSFVIQMAVMNPDLVETPFLVSYLEKYTKIYKTELKLTFKQ
jgi:hypothetical protein